MCFCDSKCLNDAVCRRKYVEAHPERFPQKGICMMCERIVLYQPPFCNLLCRDQYLMCVENSAFVKGAVKYPEYLEEIKEWYKCFVGQTPKVVNKPDKRLVHFPRSFAKDETDLIEVWDDWWGKKVPKYQTRADYKAFMGLLC